MDLEISLPVPWFRSSHHRRDGRLLVLGIAHGGMFHQHVAPKIFDSRKVLLGACVGARFCLSATLLGTANVSVLVFPAIGLFASVMWPIVISLALNSVAEHHSSFSGILSTGVVGGAVVPVIIGAIGDHVGLSTGLGFLYVIFGFVLSVGLWAKPLISNAAIALRKASVEAAVSGSTA